jgi:aldehyde:ferredoxin oxidoreductase
LEGVWQRILAVDLNKGLIGEERLPAKWYRDSLGGLGVAVQYLLEDLRSKKPLLSDPLIIMTGPLTGYPLPGTSRAAVISLRKESGQFKAGSVHGKFPAYLKLAGFDGVVISGRSETPVRIHLSGKTSKILPADALWGENVFHLNHLGRESTYGASILAIGPAGEKGHPYANLVADGWIQGGEGMGGDLGCKGVKAVLADPDGELSGNPDSPGFPSRAASYLKTNSKSGALGQRRRSCFGCVACCGIFDPGEDLLYVEEEFERFSALLAPWPKGDQVFLFRECLQLGLDPLKTAQSVGSAGPQSFPRTIQEWMSRPDSHSEPDISARSWEEAFLSLLGRYRDTVFRDAGDLSGLIERENWALIKTCLSVCERWDMGVDEMLSFFNEVTGSESSREDLLGRAGFLADQIMNLYRSLGYAPLAPEGIFSRREIPSLLRDHWREYLEGRNWKDTGFPKRDEI